MPVALSPLFASGPVPAAGWLVVALLHALVITALHRLPLLTPAGWAHAAALGTVLWGCLGWRGWLAVVLYLAMGSAVTRLGLAWKTQAGLAEARGGRRGPENVWGSAATGAVLALLAAALPASRPLLLVGFAASFSAKFADTCGSEIGKRWGGQPRLITTLRPVAPGSEGAVSLEGTLASVGGSLVMTALAAALGLIQGVAALVAVVLAGLVATLLESVLGATLQVRVTWLSNELVNALQTVAGALIAMGLWAAIAP
ncbi:DUF92 domain-containing protein [Synechococcus sp. RSCCF101]|uniref:DUF92 domain-containing protein n=1 Tax=Synechococcus sp. RSCCF101 TaxID=2511069 RepID=UPI0012446617|nr:DUF92 domain-containing protein [Synechococcus sp. RSCCF101]QEY31838.1 DUF92 domain-containing protein [Synechococcus sp. RSCCF101]